eukprot:Clim_evm33s191 gene=Clim_evmTU33s191
MLLKSHPSRHTSRRRSLASILIYRNPKLRLIDTKQVTDEEHEVVRQAVQRIENMRALQEHGMAVWVQTRAIDYSRAALNRMAMTSSNHSNSSGSPFTSTAHSLGSVTVNDVAKAKDQQVLVTGHAQVDDAGTLGLTVADVPTRNVPQNLAIRERQQRYATGLSIRRQVPRQIFEPSQPPSGFSASCTALRETRHSHGVRWAGLPVANGRSRISPGPSQHNADQPEQNQLVGFHTEGRHIGGFLGGEGGRDSDCPDGPSKSSPAVTALRASDSSSSEHHKSFGSNASQGTNGKLRSLKTLPTATIGDVKARGTMCRPGPGVHPRTRGGRLLRSSLATSMEDTSATSARSRVDLASGGLLLLDAEPFTVTSNRTMKYNSRKTQQRNPSGQVMH